MQERLHLAPARPVDTFAARHVRGLALAHRQWKNRALPAFALYEWESASLPSSMLLKVGGAAADAVPATLSSAAFRPAPVPLNGPLVFLGVSVYSQEDAVEVETWWRVTEGPVTRPLSIMAHLLDAQGTVLGVADGLGVSPLTLNMGDVVVQRHRFPVPPRGTELWLRTGAYWLDTMDRWPVMAVPSSDALFIHLELSR